MERVATILLSLSILVLVLFALVYLLGSAFTQDILIVTIALIIVVCLVCGYFTLKLKYTSIRLIILGIALILLGTSTWLYGGTQGMKVLVWAGIFGILLGNIIWIYGDSKGGALDPRVAEVVKPLGKSKWVK